MWQKASKSSSENWILTRTKSQHEQVFFPSLVSLESFILFHVEVCHMEPCLHHFVQLLVLFSAFVLIRQLKETQNLPALFDLFLKKLTTNQFGTSCFMSPHWSSMSEKEKWTQTKNNLIQNSFFSVTCVFSELQNSVLLSWRGYKILVNSEERGRYCEPKEEM